MPLLDFVKGLFSVLGCDLSAYMFCMLFFCFCVMLINRMMRG